MTDAISEGYAMSAPRRKNLRVYIAGPYTMGDVALNVRAAIEAGNQVAEAGHFPFIPHLSHFWHMLFPHEYRFWMEQDKAWLVDCDAMIRLPGASSGADEEAFLATDRRIPIFYGVQSFLESVK